MYIAGFSSSQFAGLRNISLDFGRGLNVIVGANETGKSTVVNAISAVFFTTSNLKKSRSEDKAFLAQYMPLSAGDFIDGMVKFCSQGKEYSLYKRWGSKSGITFMKPDGTILSIESDFDQELKTVFPLGPRTYQNIVFAPQSQLKEMLDRLRDRETIQSVSALLRTAVMNLDGISIGKLRANIDQELETLLKRWDYINGRPQDGKTYKTGLGIVLNSYYQQENLRREMNRAFSIEQELHEISMRLHAAENRSAAINLELARLEPLEEDVLKRAALEPRIRELKKQSSELKTVYGQWPACEAELFSQQKALEQLLRQGEQLKKEEQACRSQKEFETLDKTIKKVAEQSERLQQLKEACHGLASISGDDIAKLSALEGTINTAATAMQAGQLLASILNKSHLDLWVTRDLDSEARLEGGEIKANGYLKLRLGDLAEIEVKSGEFDYEQIKTEYAAAQREFAQELTRLGIKDLAQAQQIKKESDEIKASIRSAEQVIANVLGGLVYEELKKRRQELESTESARPLAIVRQDQEDLEKQTIEIRANTIALNNDIQVWQKTYRSQEDLLARIIALEVEGKETASELEKLQLLPEIFSHPTEFRLHIKSLRDELKQLGDELRKHWHEYDVKERELPEESWEELKLQFESAGKELAKNLTRAKTFMQLKKAFIDTLEAKDANSFQPLLDSFSRYLSRTTRGKYEIDWLDEDFTLGMIRQDQVRMPINLLSSGTYDSVALAFRFALLEQIFPVGDGFVVLDDCLVDLDAERRAEAINLIQEYARENQVIFTTCSSETARLMGGTTIQLG
jgi:DNA repair protein SbcC/Rad50